MAFRMINQEQYDNEIVKEQNPVVMIFSAPWCTYCQALKPAIIELAEELEGKVEFVGIDVDQDKALGRKYKIFTIPTLVLRNKGEDVDKVVNPATAENVKVWLKEKGVL